MAKPGEDLDLSNLKAFADEANVFMKQLKEESDRGAALVGGGKVSIPSTATVLETSDYCSK